MHAKWYYDIACKILAEGNTRNKLTTPTSYSRCPNNGFPLLFHTLFSNNLNHAFPWQREIIIRLHQSPPTPVNSSMKYRPVRLPRHRELQLETVHPIRIRPRLLGLHPHPLHKLPTPKLRLLGLLPAAVPSRPVSPFKTSSAVRVPYAPLPRFPGSEDAPFGPPGLFAGIGYLKCTVEIFGGPRIGMLRLQRCGRRLRIRRGTDVSWFLWTTIV